MLKVKRTDVAVIPIFDPQKTSGGLWIPETAKERSDQGIVKYIGDEAAKEIDVSYGDHVMYAAYDGTLTRIDGEGILIILPASKIVAIIHPPDTRIDGVYFKSPLDREEREELKEELCDIIARELHSDGLVDSVGDMAEKILKAGFLKNQYFPLSYEQNIQLIADAITNAPWKDQFRFVDRKAADPAKSNIF